MRKKFVFGAVSAFFAMPVFAQTNVTLYGIIDEGFNFTNNVLGNRNYELQSGHTQGSRWGLMGSEDLGGGLKAVFQIENGFDLDNGNLGQGGRMFGRQAYIGLTKKEYGTLTIGRQYDALVDYLAPLTSNGNWGGTLFSHPYDNDNTGNSFRVNNTVKYASPNFYGLDFGGTYSFSNQTNFSNNRQYSVGAQYARGGLLIAAAYLQANNPGMSTSGAIAANDANFIASRLRVFGGGVNYTLGPVTAGFVYTNTNLKNPSANVGYLGAGQSLQPTSGSLNGGTLTALKYQNFEINGRYQMTPTFFVGAQYVYTIEQYDTTLGNATPKIHSVAVMADYSLSKRTDIYVQGAFQKMAGDDTGSILDQAFILSAAGVSSNSQQIVARVGLRHKF